MPPGVRLFIEVRPGNRPPLIRSMPARSRSERTSANPCAGKQRADGFGLIVAMFDPQYAVGGQPCGCAGDDLADRAEAVGFVGERAARFEAQIAFRQMRIAARDIRRIADDHVKAQGRVERAVPVALLQCDRRRPGRLASSRRAALRVATASASAERSSAQTCASGRIDAIATAMAPVPVPRSRHARPRQIFHRRQRGFDQQFGFRTRNQHVRRHFEFQPEKLARADQLRHRLAGDAPASSARYRCDRSVRRALRRCA